jgi:hypothetical protein
MKTNKILILAGLLSLSFSAKAQIFKINITDYGLADTHPLYNAYKSAMDTEVAKVETDINKDLPSAPPQRLMEGMANSSVMAGKGIGSDYASNMEVALLGVGVGVGADLAEDKETDSKISGAGVAPGVIIGANLGFLKTKKILGMHTERLNVYFNYLGYKYKHNISDKPDEKSTATLDMMNAGIHFRYDWIQGSGSKLLGWGGVKFHFGYEYNKTDLTFSTQINETVDVSGSDYNINGPVRGNPEATINVATQSIPLELSTNIQLLYILSLYGGVGVDYNFGTARGRGNLNADPTTLSCTSGTGCDAAGNPDATVQAEANVDAKGTVNPFTSRAFAGVQVNLPFLRVFVQADKSLGSEVIGATAGLRFVY